MAPFKRVREGEYYRIQNGSIAGPMERDDKGYIVVHRIIAPSDERRELIIKEIGDVLWYLSAACNELGISLSEAAITNLEKLCDRTERDALRGSGDNR